MGLSFFMELIHKERNQLQPGVQDILILPTASTASFGKNSIAFRGSMLRNSEPDAIKSCNTVFVFGKNIKKLGW